MRLTLGCAAVLAIGTSALGQQIVPAVGPVNISGNPIDGNVVYDNSTSLLGFLINAKGLERGDSATLAGTDRNVDGISLLIHSNAGDVVGDVVVRLYDGGEGAADPGALLWTSSVFKAMDLLSGTNQYDFAVPGVLVGDHVTWTVQLDNVSGDPAASVGPRFLSPPTTGSSADHLWTMDAGVWAQDVFGVGAGNNNYGAIITATPTPGALSLLAMSGVVMIRRRR